MSRLRIRWLWVVIGVEVLAIAGLLVWALAFRSPEKQPVQSPQTKQNEKSEDKAPKIELVKVATGLSEPTAIAATADTNDKRLFVAEQGGTIQTVKADGTLETTPFLDIKSKIKSGGEMGLLGLAFHPKVADNNYFFVNYTDKNQNTIVARYSIAKSTGRADPKSEKVLLKIKQPYTNHNGGSLAFGPDGYLYIGMGDGGSGGDPENRTQDKNDLLGKILRINVDGDSYTTPSNNPFAQGGGKPEIWALGLRNPWRFSFDIKTGDMYIADVGQGSYEEINIQKTTSKGGMNFGWRCYEGTHKFNTEGCQQASDYTQPAIEYDHSENRCSVTGGYVYRGAKFPALTGKYFYSDYCGGQVYYASESSGTWTTTTAATTSYKPSTFGQDSSGELYLADYATGTIYHITATAN
ncbi:MAG TPA: PQQ-dependent sugar dehydrogenase [Candidatus Saccharimonadales bacterium]